MYIFDQIFNTVKGHEYIIAVLSLFIFIFFYRYLSRERK